MARREEEEEEGKHDEMLAGGRANSWLLFSITSVSSVRSKMM